MSKKKHNRWRLFADPKVQGQFCLRVVVYWLMCQLTLIGTMVAFASVGGKDQISPDALRQIAFPAFLVSMLALPFALLDTVGFSNRVVGPILNFRRRFASFVKGESVPEMSFRPGDFYEDLSANFNRLRSQTPSCPSTTIDEEKEEPVQAEKD